MVIEEPHWRVRSLALQKLVKRHNESGDPHDHVATYKQVVHAEQERDTHTLKLRALDQPLGQWRSAGCRPSVGSS